MPTLVDGRPNPEAETLDRHSTVGRGYRQPRARSRLYTPRRADVIDTLQGRDMLPAIYFIFSRSGCDDAVEQCLREGLRLTTSEERAEIRAIAEAKLDHLSDDDLRVLDFGSWITALEAGVAAHHAGMVPPFKEVVEACFSAALVKAVFATETLALGINMPARSVVIEKLTKFSGEAHEKLTPGEYTQLTGRAGRRGIDAVGYGIVLWSPFVPFDQVASLASTRSYELRSAFRPTYNMAANLVRRYEPAEAHHLLNLSFAQYRSDSEVVRAERRLERLEQEVARLRDAARCERGDVDEFMRLSAEAEQTSRRRDVSRADIERALDRIGPGDVLALPGMVNGGRCAVITTAARKAGRVLGVVTLGGKRVQLSGRDFVAPPLPVGSIELPRPYLPNNHNFHRQVADRLKRAKLRGNGVSDDDVASPKAERAAKLAAIVASHPVGGCPDVRSHVLAARRAAQRERDVKVTERQIRGRSESLARQFDRVLRILEAWGYIADDGWSLTEVGERLAGIYHESDLLVAEVLRSGLFDGLSPAEVAALASGFTYETRGPGPAPAPWFPRGDLPERWTNLEYIARELNLAEEDAGLPPTRPPDAGFVGLAYGWAKGEDLAHVIEDEAMTGGDFVRNVKQLIDLLRQLGDLADVEETRRACRQAAEALFRGVVAASSVVSAQGSAPHDHAADE